MLSRTPLLFFSLWCWLFASLPFPLWAQPQTNEETISAQVGYAEGLLPSIQYLFWMFQTADTVARKNAAFDTLRHFQMIHQAASKPHSPVVDPVELLRQSPPASRPRLSISPWWHSLLGIQSPEKDQSDRVFYNLEIHPSFENAFSKLAKVRDQLIEDITDPRLVDRSLPIYFFGRNSSLKITMAFFRTRMYLRESAGPGSDPYRNLNFSVARFKESLTVIGEIFRKPPISNPEVLRLTQDYLHEIESLDIPEFSRRRLHFLPINSATRENFEALRRKFSPASGEMGDRFAQRWGSLDINKYFFPSPGTRSCSFAHSS
jgi:hypothetical protein